MEKISRINNFDLLRLLASLQVVIIHTASHLNINIYFFKDILKYFPGVPIFFTISGFLIYSSLKRNNDLKKYFRNRALRIFPALYVCLIITIILLFIFKIIDTSTLSNKEFWLYLLGQITIFQYYTPDILRSWGVGTPNGSLWTIPVEFEFYIILPVIVLVLTKIPLNLKLLLLVIISIAVNLYFGVSESTYVKLLNVSVLPYLYCFLFGVFLCHNWSNIRKYLEGKAWLWFVIYSFYCIFFSEILDLFETGYHTNLAGFFSYFLLSCLTISLAYTYTTLSDKLLKHNDISYGIYIYHMLVVNSFLSLNLQRSLWHLVLVIFITCVLGWLSWHYIERNFLRLKK